MKVLMLSWEYPPHNVGGLGKHVTELVPALARAGVEVHLLTPRWAGGMGEQVIDEDGAGPNPPTTIYRVEPPQVDMPDFFTGALRTNVSLSDRGRELLTAGGYDLIHGHDWLVASAGVTLKHAFKVPLLATIHATEYGRQRGFPSGDVPRQIYNVEWWLTYEAWRVICCSQFMAREVETAFQAPSDKIDVIPNGVDTRRFDAVDRANLAEFRARFAHESEKIVFYIGRVVLEKGVHLLVEAFPRVLAARPDAKLVIAGVGGSLDAVRGRAEALGLGDKVLFLGFLPDEDRDRLFCSANVAVFPSIYEPFGIVALEAMAARTPVVVADVGGLSDVVEHAETGVKVYPDNVDSLVWGILHTLDHPDWAQARAANAYHVVRERYGWDAIARSTRAIYQQIAAERRAATW